MRLRARHVVVASAAAAMLFAAVVPVAQERVYEPGEGVTLPRVIRQVKPQYTREAMDAGIQGKVELSGIVRDDGTVSDVTVTKSLDAEHGLDKSAVEAFKQWQFAPGMKDDMAVAVKITVEMSFTLK
jgi:TonB family protein